MYIPTEMLDIIIDNLGDEASSQPTNSLAFQALLSFALTGHRALPQSRRNIFRVLTVDSSESKRRSISVAEHLQASLDMLTSDSHSHLARHIRRLAIHGSRAVKEAQRRGSESLNQMRASFYSIIPKILEKLDRLESLFLDGVAGSPLTFAAFHIHPVPLTFLDSLYTFLRRDISVNTLKELQVRGLRGFDGSILSELPPTLKVFKCSHLSIPTWFNSSDAKPEPAEQNSRSDGSKWRYQLNELDLGKYYSLVEPMLEWRSGWSLSSLTSLRCWMRRTPGRHGESLIRMIHLSSSTLRNLDIASYRGSDRLRNIIENDALPTLPNIQTLSLATEFDGLLRNNRTDYRCPTLIPSFFLYMAKKCPGLHTLRLHAVWSFRGTDPGSKHSGQPWFISGNRGWLPLDDLLGGLNPDHRLPHLRSVLVRATPAPMKITTSFYHVSRSRRTCSPDWLSRANEELIAVLVETKKRLGKDCLTLWEKRE